MTYRFLDPGPHQHWGVMVVGVADTVHTAQEWVHGEGGGDVEKGIVKYNLFFTRVS
jgi:hypothetical protein